MALTNAGDWKKGMKVLIEGDPYVMIECFFVKPGKGSALYKLKLRNLLRGGILDRTYRSGDALEQADIRMSPGQFMYRNGSSYVFLDNATFEECSLSHELIGDKGKFLMDGAICDLVFFNEKLIDMDPPPHIIAKVTYTEPAARGNTANAVTKEATLETGAVIQVPSFVNQDETIKVDTRTGEYVERVRV